MPNNGLTRPGPRELTRRVADIHTTHVNKHKKVIAHYEKHTKDRTGQDMTFGYHPVGDPTCLSKHAFKKHDGKVVVAVLWSLRQKI